MILPHLLLQRGQQHREPAGPQGSKLGGCETSRHQLELSGKKNKRIPNSQCQWRGHGEASSCLYLVQHSDTQQMRKTIFTKPFSHLFFFHSADKRSRLARSRDWIQTHVGSRTLKVWKERLTGVNIGSPPGIPEPNQIGLPTGGCRPKPLCTSSGLQALNQRYH